MRRPGDRKKVWKQTCMIEGFIMVLIGVFFASTNCLAGYIIGGVIASFGLWDFKDAKAGWKMSDKRPPWADKHDAITKKWREKQKAGEKGK